MHSGSQLTYERLAVLVGLFEQGVWLQRFG